MLMAIMTIMAIMVGYPLSKAAPPSRNKVVPIDPAGIEKLMEKQDCPLMIIAMAAWCSPCRKELPTLQKLYDKYKDRGLKMVGISLDIGGPSAMQSIVDGYGLQFPIYWGGEKVTEKYQISAIPSIFIVKGGKIVEQIKGARGERFLEEKFKYLLDQCDN